jgi:hypothetical protein
VRSSGALGAAVLCGQWTIDPADLPSFDAWYEPAIVRGLDEALPETIAVHRYVALLAQLHRYGGEDGELVIPSRHHVEDGGRLCYVTLVELEGLPDASRQAEVLRAVASGLARWDGVIQDRQEVFAERVRLVEHAPN